MRQCAAKAILVAWNDETDLLVMSLTSVSKWARASGARDRAGTDARQGDPGNSLLR
ncbi:hypothetical protein MetexDRAFT_3468 [Methylorubrum extorquens DSM 13060]|uniref:Uncharacterized protein n=1 Tax=Methylorubrum extorquens DSM 13060 TaxID=882800 RepID=H1KLF6_METEX|nr:hypothetical protein MetexDRAFT_3468 [Methylorubrum extorquens DSM 13060]